MRRPKSSKSIAMEFWKLRKLFLYFLRVSTEFHQYKLRCGERELFLPKSAIGSFRILHPL